MLIIGLGNPGSQYERTRHNVGWMQLDKFAHHTGLAFSLEKKHRAEIARGNYKGKTITLVKPLTYMNLSGESVVSVMNYYRYTNSDIIVVYDDKDFNLGSFKLKLGGSAAGHNGIKSLIACLKTEAFIRFRIGIGPKIKEAEMANFVLSNFSSENFIVLEELFKKGNTALESLVFDGLEKTMNIYNRKDI